MPSMLILGGGYLGMRVAQRWLASEHDVCIVTRRPNRANELRKLGYLTLVADVAEFGSLHNLPSVDSILFAVGYDRASQHSQRDIIGGGVANTLKQMSEDTGQFIFISTTGIYGDSQGNWMDERFPPAPLRESGWASLAAEQALRDAPRPYCKATLRLGGIYGPGRIPFAEKLRQGSPIPAMADGYLNLIHVEDAANIVVEIESSLRSQGQPTEWFYNVTDNCPIERVDYYNEVARLVGVHTVQYEVPPSGDPRADRAKASRRISSGKLFEEQTISLRFPTYREGLQESIEDQDKP